MAVHDPIPLSLDELVALSGFQVLAHQRIEHTFGCQPNFFAPRFCVAQQGFDFGGAEVAEIHLVYDPLSLSREGRGRGQVSLSFHALAFPADLHAQLPGGSVDEFAHAVLLAGVDNEVFGGFLLKHQPHRFDG